MHEPKAYRENRPYTDSLITDIVHPRTLRDCCGRFAIWVTIVTTPNASNDQGMTISAFMQVYLAPQLVAVWVGRQSVFLERARGAGPFFVSISPKGMNAHALHFVCRFDENFTEFSAEHGGLPALCVTPEPFSSPISGSRQRQGAISCSLGACIPYGMAW